MYAKGKKNGIQEKNYNQLKHINPPYSDTIK